MNRHIIIQQPSARAQQLFLLHHGVGGSAQDMLSIGQRLAQEFPMALIVSIEAAYPCDFGQGSQWFSVQGITEDNRTQRVAEALPYFIETITDWQNKSQLGANATALIGFSQGAIMALACTQQDDLYAGRVIALSGRFAQLPERAPEQTTLHFMHGKEDNIIHYKNCVDATEKLIALKADVTADILPFLGHQITAEVIELIIERLKGHIPKRYWEEAMKTAERMK